MKKLFKYSQQIITGLVLLAAAGGVVSAVAMPFFDGFVRTDSDEGLGIFRYGHGLITSNHINGENVDIYGYGYGYDITDRNNNWNADPDYADYGFEGDDGSPAVESIVTTQTDATVTFSTSYLARVQWFVGTDYPLNDGNVIFSGERFDEFNSGEFIFNAPNLTCGTRYYYSIRAYDAADNVWYNDDSFTTSSCNTNHESITGSTYAPTNTQQSTSHNPRGLRLPPITLALGSIGQDVKDLQILLNFFGTFLASDGAGSPGNETQTFGTRTKAALMKFQSTFGLGADGIYGQKTHDVMESFLQ